MLLKHFPWLMLYGVLGMKLRWNGIVRNHFLVSRLWFLTSLLIFMLSEAILPKTREIESIWEIRIVIFFGRTFMYLVTMNRLLISTSAAVNTSSKFV